MHTEKDHCIWGIFAYIFCRLLPSIFFPHMLCKLKNLVNLLFSIRVSEDYWAQEGHPAPQDNLYVFHKANP